MSGNDPTATEPGSLGATGRAHTRSADTVRLLARGLGQTLITLGVVVLLFVVYEVYVTDLFSHRKQEAATVQLDRLWSAEAVAPTARSAQPSSGGGRPTSAAGAATGSAAATAATAATGATEVVTVTDPTHLATSPRQRHYATALGQGFAKIYIPAFGADFVYTIIEGTAADDLNVGPGHYADTQYPGERGNFSIAGHRVSKGSPFNQLGQLASCDALIVETDADWFIYRVLPMSGEVSGWRSTPHAHCAGVAPESGGYTGVTGREITDPSDYAQVLPVPHLTSSEVPADAQRLITLTTCHPQFSDAQRMIVHGTLTRSYPKAAGFLPPELQEG